MAEADLRVEVGIISFSESNIAIYKVLQCATVGSVKKGALLASLPIANFTAEKLLF